MRNTENRQRVNCEMLLLRNYSALLLLSVSTSIFHIP